MNFERTSGAQELESLVRALVDQYLDESCGFQFELPRERFLALLAEACGEVAGPALTRRLDEMERSLERLGISVAQLRRALEGAGPRRSGAAAASAARPDEHAHTRSGMLEMLVKQNLELRKRSKESAAVSAAGHIG